MFQLISHAVSIINYRETLFSPQSLNEYLFLRAHIFQSVSYIKWNLKLATDTLIIHFIRVARLGEYDSEDVEKCYGSCYGSGQGIQASPLRSRHSGLR